MWIRKWNKIMSTVFGVLIFTLLFITLVMVSIPIGANPETSGKIIRKLFITSTNDCTFFRENNGGGDKCDVRCSTLPADLVNEFETAVADDDGECLTVGYHLRYFEPQVAKISPGWFHTTRFIRKITILDANTTTSRTITDIEPGAFDHCTFRRMTELLIRFAGVQVLKRGVFDGANNLKILRLHENVFLQHIEEYALEPLHRLEEVHLTGHQQFGNLLNFTGTNQYNHLRTLILTSNNFGTSIDAKTFKGCTRIETLNLSNSFIQSIGIGTFDHMAETIRFLDLSNNQLRYLPGKLLDIQSDIQIQLSNNLLVCDCNLAEFLAWYASNSHLIIDGPLLCDMPPTAASDVDLSVCDLTSSTPSFDDTTIPSTTTMQPPLLERLECINETLATDGDLYLEKTYQYFSVSQLEMGKVSVELTSPNPTLSMVVVNDKNESACRYDVSRKMTFTNLDPNSAHLFCLIKTTSHVTSPQNCFPFHFDDTTSIWGHDEIIIALVCSIILSLVVGTLSGWLLSRRYQRVFKAKESFHYQSSERSTSKTVTEIEDLDLTLASDYFAANKYGSDGGANPSRLRRRYSDNSIISYKSYITTVTPSPFDVIQWKLRKNVKLTSDIHGRDYLNKLDYDCLPPPLPPFPNRSDADRLYETILEPDYMRTSEIDPYKIAHSRSPEGHEA